MRSQATAEMGSSPASLVSGQQQPTTPVLSSPGTPTAAADTSSAAPVVSTIPGSPITSPDEVFIGSGDELVDAVDGIEEARMQLEKDMQGDGAGDTIFRVGESQ